MHLCANIYVPCLGAMGDFDMSRNKELVKWNDSKIAAKYSSLKIEIAKKLEGIIEPKEMISFIQSLPNCEDCEDILKDSDSILKIFNRLYKKKYWHFYDISPLCRIVEEYLEDSDEIIKRIDEYEEMLTGFMSRNKELVKWNDSNIGECSIWPIRFQKNENLISDLFPLNFRNQIFQILNFMGEIRF